MQGLGLSLRVIGRFGIQDGSTKLHRHEEWQKMVLSMICVQLNMAFHFYVVFLKTYVTSIIRKNSKFQLVQ